MHLLFVCTAGRQRSVTAAELLANDPEYEAKAVGIHPLADTQVTQTHIDWADIVFVLNETEDGHLTFIKQHFELGNTPVYDLDISDIYPRGHPELVRLLKGKLSTLGFYQSAKS